MLLLQLLVNGLATASLAAPTAMGFALILGVHRFWHLAHGAVFVWTCYLTYLVVSAAPFWVGAALAPIIGAAVGLAVDTVVYRALRARRTSGLVMLVGSLGVYIAATNTAAAIFGFDPRVPRGGSLNGRVVSGSVTVTQLQVAMAVAGVVSLAAVVGLLATRGVGLQTRAVLADPEMAAIVGVRLPRIQLISMGVGSALLGWPALLTTVDTGADPTSGLNVVLIAAIAAIIGGMTSVTGAYLGALLVGVASTVPLAYISPAWQQVIAFAILIIFMLVRPTGFFGNVIWKARV